MTGWFEVGIVVLSWAIVIWRRPPLRHAVRESPLWMTFAALAVALTIRIPKVSSVIEQATGVAEIGTLLKHTIGIVAMLSLINWATALTSRGTTPLPWTAPRYVVAAVSIVAMVGLFLAIPGREPGPDDYFITDHAGNGVATLYQLVFVGYVALAMVVATVLFGRSARDAEGGLRRSLVMMSIGSAVGIGYTVLRAAYLAGTQWGGAFPGGDAAFESASKWLKIVTIALVCLGTSYPAYAALSRARTQWSLLRALEPLWALVTAPVPHVVLVDRDELPSRFDPRDTDFRLHRRVIEIRDAALTLRDTAPPGLHAAARRAAHDAGHVGDEADAVAEAVWLTVASSGDPDTGDESYQAHPADRTEEDALWLAQVSAHIGTPEVRALADELTQAHEEGSRT